MHRPQPHSRNLRNGRFSEAGRAYLVTFTTQDRVPYLRELAPARLVVCVLRSVKQAQTLAFVIMPDHVHWLLELADGAVLARVVQYVKSVTARRLNRHLGRSGKFWQDGFHDRALRREEDLKAVARYIVSNPTRAGLAQTVKEYPHWDACWL